MMTSSNFNHSLLLKSSFFIILVFCIFNASVYASNNTQLLEKFSPILYLYKNDYTPMSIDEFIAHSILVRKNGYFYTIVGVGKDITLLSNNFYEFNNDIIESSQTISINNIPALNNNDEYYLDFLNRRHGGYDFFDDNSKVVQFECQNSGTGTTTEEGLCKYLNPLNSFDPYSISSLSNPTIYGRVYIDPTSNKKYLQYYLFYFINQWNGNGGPATVGYHEGDWEFITIELDKDDQPIRVSSSIHVPGADINCTSKKGGETLCWDISLQNTNDCLSAITKIDNHPIAYIGKGGHPTYLFKGTTMYDFTSMQNLLFKLNGFDYHDSENIAYIHESLTSFNNSSSSIRYQVINIDENENVKNWLKQNIVWGHMNSRIIDYEVIEPPVKSPLALYLYGNNKNPSDDGRYKNTKKWMDERVGIDCKSFSISLPKGTTNALLKKRVDLIYTLILDNYYNTKLKDLEKLHSFLLSNKNKLKSKSSESINKILKIIDDVRGIEKSIENISGNKERLLKKVSLLKNYFVKLSIVSAITSSLVDLCYEENFHYEYDRLVNEYPTLAVNKDNYLLKLESFIWNVANNLTFGFFEPISLTFDIHDELKPYMNEATTIQWMMDMENALNSIGGIEKIDSLGNYIPAGLKQYIEMKKTAINKVYDQISNEVHTEDIISKIDSEEIILDEDGNISEIVIDNQGSSAIMFIKETPKDYSYHTETFNKEWTFKIDNILNLNVIILNQNFLTYKNLKINTANYEENSFFTVSIELTPNIEYPLNRIELQFKDQDNNIIKVNKSDIFWAVIRTNHLPTLNPSQKYQTACCSGCECMLRIDGEDLDNDPLSYRIIENGSDKIMLNENILRATYHDDTVLHTLNIAISDGKEEIKKTFYILNFKPESLIDFYSDVDETTKHYKEIFFSTLKGIVIGDIDQDDSTKRVFKPYMSPTWAEVLKMVIKWVQFV